MSFGMAWGDLPIDLDTDFSNSLSVITVRVSWHWPVCMCRGPVSACRRDWLLLRFLTPGVLQSTHKDFKGLLPLILISLPM